MGSQTHRITIGQRNAPPTYFLSWSPPQLRTTPEASRGAGFDINVYLKTEALEPEPLPSSSATSDLRIDLPTPSPRNSGLEGILWSEGFLEDLGTFPTPRFHNAVRRLEPHVDTLLKKLSGNLHHLVQEGASAALAEYGQDVIPKLLKCYGSARDDDVKVTLLRALAWMKRSSITQAHTQLQTLVNQALRDSSPEVREKAAEAALILSPKDARALLEEAQERETDFAVLEIIEDSLKDLDVDS